MIPTEAPTPCQDNPAPFDAVLDQPSKERVEAAKRICRDCDQREPCVLHALAHGLVSVYGGRLLLTRKPNWLKEPAVETCQRCGVQRPTRSRRFVDGLCHPCSKATS